MVVEALGGAFGTGAGGHGAGEDGPGSPGPGSPGPGSSSTGSSSPGSSSTGITPELSVPLIELRGIHKTFGNQPILNGVDLKIWEGDRIAVIGPSGTGKSTILRIIAGLLMPDQGQVLLRGEPRRSSIEDSTDPFYISLVFQQAALFDSLSVGENVGFFLYQHSTLSPPANSDSGGR